MSVSATNLAATVPPMLCPSRMCRPWPRTWSITADRSTSKDRSLAILPRGPSLRPYDGPRYHNVSRNRMRSDDFHGMDGESSHSSTNRFLSLFNSAATAGAGAIEALRGYSFTGADVAGDADPEACIICFSRDTDSCLLECGHVIMCFPCAAMVAKQMPNACPLCRVPIRFVVRITTPPFRLSDGRTLAVSGEGYAVRTDVVAAFARATARRAPTRGHRQNRPQEPQPPRQPQSIPT